MSARPGGTSWAVRLSVARRGGWLTWLAVNGDFERDLAGQESDSVLTPHVEAESRRGRDHVRVTIAMTVTAPDIAQALTAAWWTFRKAAGNDTEGWDMAGATAEVRPQEALPARASERLVARIVPGEGTTSPSGPRYPRPASRCHIPGEHF